MGSDGGTTVSSLIGEAAGRLRAAGVVKPKREAHRLWAWMSSRSLGEAWLAADGAPGAGQVEAYQAVVDRRVAGEPLAYVLGTVGFRRLELHADRRALIPRPETEGVVELALALQATGEALDLGTGSGCIALALAQEGGFASVTGVDVSPGALALARENAARTGLAVRWVESDLDAGLGEERFDLVVSNPPYLTEAEYEGLEPSVRAWEPALALAAGPDGLAVTRRVVAAARRRLRPGGALVVELDCTRSEASAVLAREAGFLDVRVSDDLFGRARYLVARQGNVA